MQARLRQKLGIYAACLVLIFTATACAHIPQPIAAGVPGELEHYKPTDTMLLPDNQIQEFADDILAGRLVVSDNLWGEVPVGSLNDIDWDMQVGASPNTYSLYLHGLNSVYYLAQAYVSTENEDYFEAAGQIIASWAKYNSSNTNKNRYTWYDHAVAMRTENLLFYTLVLTQKAGKTDALMEKMIADHAQWLMDDSHYYFKHNHGMIQDMALIRAGYYMDQQEWIAKGRERLNDQLIYAFPNQYAHIENSTGYHIGILGILKHLNEFLTWSEDSYAETISQYFNGAETFYAYMQQPNGASPSIGDTFSAGKTLNSGLNFIPQTKNREDYIQNPTGIFLKDGYVVMRECLPSQETSESTWLMFRSGFNSTTHKHRDDLSFALYSKGYEIFIDPGMYNYMVGNPIHDYLNSNLAHNTISVDNSDYPLGEGLFHKAGLLNYTEQDGIRLVRGYNNLYPGVKIDRNMTWLDENTFFIVDDIQSGDEHLYGQVFHLSDWMEVVSSDKETALLRITDTDWYVRLRQIAAGDGLDIVKGIDDTAMSVRSAGLNQAKDTTSLRFEKTGTNTQFLTLIEIIDRDELDQEPHEPVVGEGFVEYQENLIDTSSRIRTQVSELSVTAHGNEVIITQPPHRAQSTEPFSYCYYIIDQQSKEAVYKSGYSYGSKSCFSLEKGKDYLIKSYVKNKDGETDIGISGSLRYRRGQFIYSPRAPEDRYPHVSGLHYKHLDGATYQFSLDTAGFNDMAVRWYIYRNGASYDYLNGGSSIEYTFQEPGIYTCIFRIRDVYFSEIEQNHFPEINFES